MISYLTLLAPAGGTMYHRGIFFSRTLERQIILNWNFVTFNILLWWIKCQQLFSEKVCQLLVITVLSRASADIFMYSFCVVNFIGNYTKVFNKLLQQTTLGNSFINFLSRIFKIMEWWRHYEVITAFWRRYHVFHWIW